MKSLLEADGQTISRLADRLKKARARPEYQRIQCVLLRLTLGSSAAEIAQVLGWATTTVHNIHSRFAREGEAIFDLKAKGGRNHQNLTPEQEATLLAPFMAQAREGAMLEVARVRSAYEQRVGRPVAQSTIYRMLNRHGWRKVVPRPRHPKADVAAQAAFKKTAPSSTPGGCAPS